MRILFDLGRPMAGCGANAGQGGRMWTSGAGSVRDTMGKPLEEKIKNTDGLIEIVKSKKYTRLMVSARPGGCFIGIGILDSKTTTRGRAVNN